VHHLRREDEHLAFEAEADALDGVLASLPAHGVRSLVAHPPTLEDLFLREYSDELAAARVPEDER
jgi:ABC-2 type transport system ATP-binding protein